MLPAILAALPLLARIPSAVKGVASLVGGDTAEKIAKGADFVDSVTQAITGPTMDPATLEQIMGVVSQYDVQIQALRQKELETVMAHEDKVQETAQVEAKSTDEYVRRTRPGILRKHFWLIAAQTVGMFVITYLGKWPTDQMLMGIVVDMMKANFYIFAMNYGGYAAVRSIWDKRDPNSPGPGAKLMNMVRGKFGG